MRVIAISVTKSFIAVENATELRCINVCRVPRQVLVPFELVMETRNCHQKCFFTNAKSEK